MSPNKPPKVAIVSGQWGQNIGNAFFNLGGMYLMENVFGNGQVGFFKINLTTEHYIINLKVIQPIMQTL